jgi:hypothetical protein
MPPTAGDYHAVYTEFHQELRRTRTVYETLVVAETGGFAILLSQLDPVVTGARLSARIALVIPIFVLMIILLFLIRALAMRYWTWTEQIADLEGRMGFVDPPTRAVRDTSKGPHAIWAGILYFYTLILTLFSTALILTRNLPSGHSDARLSAGMVVGVTVAAALCMFVWLVQGFHDLKWQAVGWLVAALALGCGTGLAAACQSPGAGKPLKITGQVVTSGELAGEKYNLVAVQAPADELTDSNRIYLLMRVPGKDGWQVISCGHVRLADGLFLAFRLDPQWRVAPGSETQAVLAVSKKALDASYSRLSDVPPSAQKSDPPASIRMPAESAAPVNQVPQPPPKKS